MYEFITKQGDTRTALKATLTTADGTFDTASKVYFRMADTVGNNRIRREVDVTDLPNVVVIFKAEEVAESGEFYGEFAIEYTDGKVETIPNNDYIHITIKRKMGD